jgi:hypothetical protein
MAVLLVLGALALTTPHRLGTRRLWSYALLIAVLLLPNLLHIYAVSHEAWGASGPKFALSHFIPNIQVNGPYYINNELFPVLFTLLALAGLFNGRVMGAWRGILLIWLMIFWGIFLFFYAGSYKYGADVRFALLSFIPLAVLAGSGCSWVVEKISAVFPAKRSLVAAGMTLVLLFNGIQFFPMIRQVGQEAWSSRSDHDFAKRFIEKIPRRSIVLTHNPTMFLLWGQSAIQAYAGIHRPELIARLMKRYDGHVYFHENYWCNVASKPTRRLCQAIRDNYDLIEIDSATEQTHTYGLHKMRLK